MSEIHHPVIELTIVRTKEFLRETEAIFWVFGFPLILALGLRLRLPLKAARPGSGWSSSRNECGGTNGGAGEIACAAAAADVEPRRGGRR